MAVDWRNMPKNLLITVTLLDEDDELGPRKIILKPGASRAIIGRSSSNASKDLLAARYNLYFDNRVISRNHAELIALPSHNEVYITDTHSTHGTWVNNIKITSGRRTLLENGDVITLGEVVTRGNETYGAVRIKLIWEWKDDTSRNIDEIEAALGIIEATNTFTAPGSESEDETRGYPSDSDSGGSESSHPFSENDSNRSDSPVSISRELLEPVSEKPPREEASEDRSVLQKEAHGEAAEDIHEISAMRSYVKTLVDLTSPEPDHQSNPRGLETARSDMVAYEESLWATPEPEDPAPICVASTVPESAPQPVLANSPSEVGRASPPLAEEAFQAGSDHKDRASPWNLGTYSGAASRPPSFIDPVQPAKDRAENDRISMLNRFPSNYPPANAYISEFISPPVDPQWTPFGQPSSSKTTSKQEQKPENMTEFQRSLECLRSPLLAPSRKEYKTPYTQGPFALGNLAMSSARETEDEPIKWAENNGQVSPLPGPEELEESDPELPSVLDRLPRVEKLSSLRSSGIASLLNPVVEVTQASQQADEANVRTTLPPAPTPPPPSENQRKRKLDETSESGDPYVVQDYMSRVATNMGEGESYPFPDAQPREGILFDDDGWDYNQLRPSPKPVGAATSNDNNAKRQCRASPQAQTKAEAKAPIPVAAQAPTQVRSRGRTIARYAATALMGAVAGGIGTIATLAALPPNYFE